MIPSLRIQLLGGFHLSVDDQPITQAIQRRQQALLAYLLLHRHAPQPRQQVAYCFWPDSSEGQAHTNLRKLFFLLRESLPASDLYLYADSQSMGWRQDAPYTLDLAELQDALNALVRGETPLVPRVERIVALYPGELLPACYEEWLLPIRRALHEQVVSALTQALTGLEAQHEFIVALRVAEHLLRLDPLHETTYRQLMHLRMLNGDRAGALRVYHECVTALEKELEVEPAPETQALYQHLLNFKAETTTELPFLPSQRHEHVPLVGRTHEWQVLQQAWNQMGRRGPHFIAIWGEAGMGKTRLVEELLHWVRMRPGSVAYARVYAAEGNLAYTPITAWLRSEAVRPALAKLEPLWLGELVRLLPEVHLQHPTLPSPTPLGEGWQRQRFHEAVARALLAAPAPRLLILDDLQWCDEETLNWLRYLLHFDAQAPLLVVGTVRSEAVDALHPLHGLIRHLQREEQVTTLELGPLQPDETAALARKLVAEVSDAWASELHDDSEGNPLFIVETVRAGRLTEERPPSSTVELPPTVQAVIAARLAQLTPLAQQVAQVAATIGRSFTFDILSDILCAAGNTPEANLVQGLDELWQRRIVREQVHGYDFCHDKIREVVYSQISRTRRHWLHRSIAEALEAHHARNLEEVYGILAAHFERATEWQRAIDLWLQAGEHALATYAPQQAIDNFQRALALMLEMSSPGSHLADAYFGLGRAYFACDQLNEAAVQGQHALESLQPGELLRPKLLYFMAEVAFANYDIASCESYAEAARKEAEASNDPETFCQSLSLLGQVCSARGDVESELQLITQALQRCRQLGNRWREGRTLADLGWLHAQRAEFEQAISVAEAALSALATTSDQAGIAFAWNVLGRAHGGCGHYSSAFSAFAHSEEVATAIDHKFMLAQVPNMRGWLHYQLGDYARALELDQHGLQLAQSWHKTPAEISAHINVALDLLQLGDAKQAMTQLQMIQARIEQDAFGFHAWRWRLRLLEGQALCYLAQGQPEQAYALGLAGEQLAISTTSRKYRAANQALLGLALAQMQQTKAAIDSLEQAVALADTIGYQPLRWRGRMHLTTLYQAAGRNDAAQACHARAVQVIQVIATDLMDDSLRTTFLGTSDVQTLMQLYSLKIP